MNGLRGVFERVFVMEPAEDGLGGDTPAGGEAMAVRLPLGGHARRWVRHGTDGRMRSSAVVMPGPFADGAADMALGERNAPIETLPAQ